MELSDVVVQIDQNEKLSYNENIIPHLRKELLELVNKRIISEKLDAKEEYEKYKRHDSILIDGTRGSGKSTAIGFLKEDDKLLQRACILSILDPNQLDPSTKILNVIIDNIFESVEEQQTKRKFDITQETLFKDICLLKSKIDGLTHRISFIKERSLYDMTQITKEERKLDETIHEFAYKVCHYLGKDVLVQPIDDIDMALEFGPLLLETLRKYMQTPRIIPIVALDSGQIYALIKKEYFEPFGYNAKTPLNDIQNQSELTFLKKLPSEYIQKILPPSHRIILPDMLEVYRMHIEHSNGMCRHRNHDHFKVFFRGYSANGDAITLPFEELLGLMMSIFFGFFDKSKIQDPLDYHVTNYLKNKTFRSFLDDARAIFKALVKEDDGSYRVDTTPIKERFRLYSKSYANDRYDAAVWFWDNYVNAVYEKLETVRKKEKDAPAYLMFPDHIEEILMVTPNDAANLGRKEKTYYRIFLQEFFLRETKVVFEPLSEKTKVKEITKTISLQGYLEFLMRTIFPATLFEIVCRNELVDISLFPLENLKEFAKDDGINKLHEIYDEKVVAWPDQYGEKTPFHLGIYLEETTTQPFRRFLLEFTKQEGELGDSATYYLLHPFKGYCFRKEYVRDENNRDQKQSIAATYMPEGHLGKRKGRLEYAVERISSEILLSVTNATIGVIASIKTTKKWAKNILWGLTLVQQRQKEFENQLRFLALSEQSRKLLFRVETQKYIASFNAQLLNMLVITFIKILPDEKHGLQLFSDRLESGVSMENILFPFVVDDPFLRNLVVLMRAYEQYKKDNSKTARQIKEFVDVVNKLWEKLDIWKVYFIQHHNPLLSKYLISDSRTFDLTSMIKILIHEEQFIKAYFELFYKTMNKDQQFLKDIQQLNKILNITDEEHAEYSKKCSELYLFLTKKRNGNLDDIVNNDEKLLVAKSILETLIKEKIGLSKEDQNYYVKRNALILLTDTFIYYPLFIKLFSNYIQEQQTR